MRFPRGEDIDYTGAHIALFIPLHVRFHVCNHCRTVQMITAHASSLQNKNNKKLKVSARPP